MPLIQAVLDDTKQKIEYLNTIYANQIIPFIRRRSPYTLIASAVAAFISYQLYKMAQVPKQLRHIPAVPYWKYMRSALSSESADVRTQKIVLPVLARSRNGVYLRPYRGGWTVCVAGPAAVKSLFIRKDDFPKHESFSLQRESLLNKFIGTENIVALNGHVWKKHRMIANPAFHRSMPVKLFGRLCEKMMIRFEKEGDGLNNVDLPMFLQRFTLDVIGLAAFGYDFEALDTPENEKVDNYNEIMEGILRPIYFFFPILEKSFLWALPKRQQLHRKMDEMNKLFYNVIENKRKTLANLKDSVEDTEKDLLTLMLEAGEDAADSQHRLSDSELRDDLAIFFLAGHDTTSNALSFAIYFLAAHPHIQAKARTEVIEILGDGDDAVYPTSSQCSQMKYVYMVLKETLRICPPAPNTSPRKNTEDFELAGTFIPQGSSLTAEIYALHHNPAVWKNPETFDPERFGPGGESEFKAGTGLPWLPFANGPRQCIGMNFSLAEQKVVLSMMLRKFTWTLPLDSINKDHVVLGKGMGILSPQDLRVDFSKRF
ncbi:cytochrome P450 [Umbelopsis sp. AD052]|nr:cytochrome P450 [Umbelopsis sp. AD052]